jgi:transcriptional regulator with XRE-family HTH domain
MAKPTRATKVFEELSRDAAFQQAKRELAPFITLANNVLRFRSEQQLSQAELAAAAGMSQPRVADIEGAKGNPSLETIVRLAAALRVTPADLLQADCEPRGSMAATKMVGHALAVVGGTHGGPMLLYQDPELKQIFYSRERTTGGSAPDSMPVEWTNVG